MTTTRATVGLLLAGYAGLVGVLVLHWRADPAAVDRYLILLAAAWAAWKKWPEAAAVSAPRPHLGLILALFGAAIFPVAWAAHFAMIDARALPYWLLAAGVTLAAAGWLLAAYGPAALRRLAFPLAFVAFALPPIDTVTSRLQPALQTATTTLAEWALRVVGFSVTRPNGGFVLHLPGGALGVEEACSGVIALNALTAAAAFLAFLRRGSLLRGAALVACAGPVVVAANVLRVFLSGVIQEAAGAEYIRGGWHDALGLTTVLLGMGAVWRLSRRLIPAATPPAGPPPAVRPRPTPAVLVVLALGLLASAAAVGQGVRLSEPDAAAPDFDTLPATVGGWAETRRLEVPGYIADTLHPDVIAHREYRDPLGQSAFVWLIYWRSARSVRGYHHPDVCLPNAGWREAERGRLRVEPAAGGAVVATTRRLTTGERELYAVYWTQTGRRVWGEADEEEARLALRFDRAFARGLGRYFESGPADSTARLVVLIGSPGASAFGRTQVDVFAKAMADALYSRYPAGAPPVPPAPPAGK